MIGGERRAINYICVIQIRVKTRNAPSIQHASKVITIKLHAYVLNALVKQ
jgi:hypothetical protein